MSIDFNSWIGQNSGLISSQIPMRASIQWGRILDKQTDVVLLREGVALPVQTVRIEMENVDTESDSSIGQGYSRVAMIFGIHGHPQLDDTDIEEWDTFVYHDMEFTVTSVNRQLLGQIQASCRVSGS